MKNIVLAAVLMSSVGCSAEITNTWAWKNAAMIATDISDVATGLALTARTETERRNWQRLAGFLSLLETFFFVRDCVHDVYDGIGNHEKWVTHGVEAGVAGFASYYGVQDVRAMVTFLQHPVQAQRWYQGMTIAQRTTMRNQRIATTILCLCAMALFAWMKGDAEGIHTAHVLAAYIARELWPHAKIGKERKVAAQIRQGME